MKNLKFPSIFILFLSLTVACNNTGDELSPSISDDAELMDAIQSSNERLIVTEEALPANTLVTLETDYEESYVTQITLATNLGYEVNLRQETGSEVGTLSLVFFNLEGRELGSIRETRSDSLASRMGDRQDRRQDRRDERREGRRGRRDKDCFEIVFPFSLTMPDASVITLNREEDWNLVKSWYENNEDPEAGRPEFVYPIEITLEDGSQVAIQNAEELASAKATCKFEDRQERNRDREPCFEVAFPFTFTMPDSVQITLNSEEDWDLVLAWYNENPEAERERPTYVYPIHLIYEDGTTGTINNDDEFLKAMESCREDARDHQRCFALVFPYTISLPDSSEITLNSKDDLALVRTWYQENPDYRGEKPSLVFPVEISYGEDDTQTINNVDELIAAKEACRDEEEEE